MQGVTVLGSTGSIGINTLDVLAGNADRYHVVALTANQQSERLFEQCRRFKPEFAVMMDDAAALSLRDRVRRAGLATEVLAGIEGLKAVTRLSQVETVVAAIVGAAGLPSTLEAVKAGKRVLIANKEPLVMVGDLIMDQARLSGAKLIPVDSEHNAIFQCMPAGFAIPGKLPTVADDVLQHLGVRRILLTGSGGPFRATPIEDLARVTPDQACAHPTWSMGRKISVDSATMMNKGLELIEACRLFSTTPDHIQIVVHPQSVIHSMVEYVDGSVLGQLGVPDMRTPITHALAWPERMQSGVESLDLLAIGRLDFEAPNPGHFPCLRLAEGAARRGGTAPALLNAANEVAVARFLAGGLSFTGIAEVIEQVLSDVAIEAAETLDVVLAADARARDLAVRHIDRRQAGKAPATVSVTGRPV